MRSDAAGKFGEGALNVCTACYAAKGGQEQGEKQIWRGMFLPLQIGSLLGGGPREEASERTSSISPDGAN